MIVSSLLSKLDLTAGTIDGAPLTRRHLGDLKGCFADGRAFDAALGRGNPLIYTVASVEPAQGDGALHYGLGVVMPGRVGREYFMTKGHYHAWRPAAEVYVGLRGDGYMLLEDEQTGESRMLPLGEGKIVYVPGGTAHRTLNTGGGPLVYLGVYPAAAGHDYAAIAERNFRSVVIEEAGAPVMIDRVKFQP